MWNHKGPRTAKATLRKESSLEESHSLTSNYIRELQQLKQHGTGRRADMWTRGIEPRYKPTYVWSVNSRRRSQDTQQGKDGPLNRGRWENWTPSAPHTKPMKNPQCSNQALLLLGPQHWPPAVSHAQEASPHFSRHGASSPAGPEDTQLPFSVQGAKTADRTHTHCGVTEAGSAPPGSR